MPGMYSSREIYFSGDMLAGQEDVKVGKDIHRFDIGSPSEQRILQG